MAFDRKWLAVRKSELEEAAGQIRADFPYHTLVPKERKANLEFRLRWQDAALADREVAADIVAMCAKDPLFYINLFGVGFDPRKSEDSVEPFITWPAQDELVWTIWDAIEKGESVRIEKSRDQGASFICLYVVRWYWRFGKNLSFLLASRKAENVDNAGDPSTLMGKLDLMHQYEPGWLRPTVDRVELKLRNVDRGSIITGESTNNDLGRSGRQTAVLLDEFGAVENGYKVLSALRTVTRTKIVNSTTRGSTGPFHDMKNARMRKVYIHWSLHPVQSEGLYFDSAEKPRSPWYDLQCEEAAFPQEIAQELDMDEQASQSMAFPPELLETLRTETVRAPFLIGELDFTEGRECQPRGFEETVGGHLVLWHHLLPDGRPPDDRRYVIGVDCATGQHDESGLGASNSVLSVLDRTSGEKVGEYACSSVYPDVLAAYAVALARWYAGDDHCGAYLIWESNGPGGPFGSEVMDLGYTNVYMRRNIATLTRKVTETPGWWSDPKAKRRLLSAYIKALRLRTFVNRSGAALRECGEYVLLPNGDIVHAQSRSALDPAATRENHGDRVIADAVANWGMIEVKEPVEEKEEEAIPRRSFAFRRQERQRRARATASNLWPIRQE